MSAIAMDGRMRKRTFLVGRSSRAPNEVFGEGGVQEGLLWLVAMAQGEQEQQENHRLLGSRSNRGRGKGNIISSLVSWVGGGLGSGTGAE